MKEIRITSQEEFDELLNSSTWFDTATVHFVGATGVSYSKSDGTSIVIPSNVTEIIGVNFPIIVVKNLSGEADGYAGIMGEDDDIVRNIDHIILICSGARGVCGFMNCNGINACTIDIRAGANYISRAFYNCEHINNCISSVTVADQSWWEKLKVRFTLWRHNVKK